MFIAKLIADLPEYNMKAGQYVCCSNVFTNKHGIETSSIMVSASERLYLNIQSDKLVECDEIEIFNILSVINKL